MENRTKKTTNFPLTIGVLLILLVELSNRYFTPVPRALRLSILVISVALMIVGIVMDNFKFLAMRHEMRTHNASFAEVRENRHLEETAKNLGPEEEKI